MGAAMRVLPLWTAWMVESELFDGHAFEEVCLRAGLQGAEDVLVAVECGEDDETCGGVFGADV